MRAQHFSMSLPKCIEYFYSNHRLMNTIVGGIVLQVLEHVLSLSHELPRAIRSAFQVT